MPDLLLELFCEEIPARMQRRAAGDLRKLVTDALVEAGLTYEGAREYWTPRRLALDVRGLTARSADTREERKGPRTDAPEKAIAGFLRGAGLEDIAQADLRSDPKKGDFYVAVIEKPGRAAEEIIAEAMPPIIRAFPWPKSMRWGESSAKAGSLRWVRPLQSILCTFGPETEEPVVIGFEVDGVTSGTVTRGHRFHAPEPITVRRFDDYVASLEKARVVLDAERRKEMIRADAANLAFARGLELVEDEALLEEVANLVEWPAPLVGTFEEGFLDIPDEVIRLTIKENQKCFVTAKQGGALTNAFILVSNIEASDGGAEIARGNAKVVNARLSDAKFFWETDLQQIATDGFDPWIEKLEDVTFHAKLGSQGDRIRRIVSLAEELAPMVGADPEQAKRAAQIAKADLSSLMVYEFPELQGFMGRQYSLKAGEEEAVARVAQEHYSPLGPSDDVPTDPVSVAVALADKLDTLIGFWAIDEKPTGSKDPYALRRAALGVIRLVLESRVKLDIQSSILNHHPRIYTKPEFAYRLITRDYEGFFEYPAMWLSYDKVVFDPDGNDHWNVNEIIFEETQEIWVYEEELYPSSDNEIPEELQFQVVRIGSEVKSDRRQAIEKKSYRIESATSVGADLLSFFHDRLKVYLRDQGARHDLIDAVIAPESDDLLAITRRVEALGSFLDTEDGKNLLAGTKRAANILAAEEKKGTAIADAVDPALFEHDEERDLFTELESAEADARQAIECERYADAMTALSRLRAPVDAFFEAVLVNADDQAVRANRLALMRRIRDATGAVADFSKIAG